MIIIDLSDGNEEKANKAFKAIADWGFALEQIYNKELGERNGESK